MASTPPQLALSPLQNIPSCDFEIVYPTKSARLFTESDQILRAVMSLSESSFRPATITEEK